MNFSCSMFPVFGNRPAINLWFWISYWAVQPQLTCANKSLLIGCLFRKQPVTGEALCISDKDLSAAGGVGQGALRPTDRQADTRLRHLQMRRAPPNQTSTRHPEGLQSRSTIMFILERHSFLRYQIIKLTKSQSL